MSLLVAWRGKLEEKGQNLKGAQFEGLWNENLHVDHYFPDSAVPQFNSSCLEHLIKICFQLCLPPVSPDKALTRLLIA